MTISKTLVRKAGEALRRNPCDPDALEVLAEWRNLHSHPMRSLGSMVRRKTRRKGEYAGILVAQRLKRIPTIISKLTDLPGMGLDRMQDLGGVRAVVEDMATARSLYGELCTSGRMREVIREHDYVSKPRDTGYRGLHAVYACRSDSHPETNGMLVEMQVRTRLQHAWAMTVEILDGASDASLKRGLGNADDMEFMRLCSSLFALREGTPPHARHAGMSMTELARAVRRMDSEHGVISRLSTLAAAGRTLGNLRTDNCHAVIITLNERTGITTVVPFPRYMMVDAERQYAEMERASIAGHDSAVSAVLVVLDRLLDARKAYPSYFLDSNVFLDTVRDILQ